jgi:hypothetical protein
LHLLLIIGVQVTVTADEKPASAQVLNNLKWAEPAEDIRPQIGLSDILIGLQLLATDEAREKAASTVDWDGSTPGSVQVIKSGALSITKWWTKVCAGVGGITGVLALIAGTITSGLKDLADPVTATLIGSGALVLSATAIAIALFVSADLKTRGHATAARHTARAHVTAAFLQATAALQQSETGRSTLTMPLQILLALAAFPKTVKVATKGHPAFRAVTGLRHDVDEGLQLHLADGDWIAIDKVTCWSGQP